MRKLIILIKVIIIFYTAQAQAISADGSFISVSIDKSGKRDRPVLIVQSTTNGWKREFLNGRSGGFSRDSKKFLFLKSDTLFIVINGTENIQMKPDILSWEEAKEGSGGWIVCQIKSVNNVVLLLNINTGKEFRYSNVISSYFNSKCDCIGLITKKGSDVINEVSLRLVDLKSGKENEIWVESNTSVEYCCFDRSGRQLSFMSCEKKGSEKRRYIWLYKIGWDRAKILISNEHLKLNREYEISRFSNQSFIKPMQFSNAGNKLFFYIQEKFIPINRRHPQTDVWSYLDPKESSSQIKDALITRKYFSVMDIGSGKIIQIEKSNKELLSSSSGLNSFDDSNALVLEYQADIFDWRENTDNSYRINEMYSMDESNWNKCTESKAVLVSLTDGTRRVIKDNIKPQGSFFPSIELSPAGKFVIWCDEDERKIYSYEISTGSIRIVSGMVKCYPVIGKTKPNATLREYSVDKIMAWIKGDAAFFIGDVYGDVWEIDPLAHKSPINFTEGYGKKNGVMFNMLRGQEKVYNKSEQIFLKAESIIDYYGMVGLYAKNTAGTRLRSLIKEGGDYYFDFDNAYGKSFCMSENKTTFIIQKENIITPPSYYYTRDFKNFAPVISQELDHRTAANVQQVTWKTYDGALGRGILIKPKGFNSDRKYPVLINYYEASHRSLNMFKIQSNYDTGYIKFIPDIKYTLSETGASAFNYVVSGAEYLKTMPFIDGMHMGIYGTSFGGFENNYIVTHSNLFAAAFTECGVSDLISYVGTEDKDIDGYTYSAGANIGQYRLGVTLWQRPDIYIKNSPIFFANRITTPLLIAHSSNDFRVPFGQGVEMFKALRRLGKPCWLLVTETGHATYTETYAKQFFDHYLKGKSAPLWMLEPIPAREQGEIRWMDLDTSGRTPPQGGVRRKSEIVMQPQQKLLLEETNIDNNGQVELLPIYPKNNTDNIRQ